MLRSLASALHSRGPAFSAARSVHVSSDIKYVPRTPPGEPPVLGQVEKEAPKMPVQAVIKLRRVSKVMKGGKMLRFSSIVVVGNKKGVAGIGQGKDADQAAAVRKGVRDAYNRRDVFEPYKGSVLYPVTTEVRKTKVIVRPLSPGLGLRCSNTIRPLLAAYGIEDCGVKIVGSRNPMNSLLALKKALDSIDSMETIALKTGKRLVDIKAAAKRSRGL